MKKVLVILGVIFGVILVAVGIAAAIFIPHALKLDHEATAYIQVAVPKIVEHWKSQELTSRATPELLKAAGSQDRIDRLFVMFRRLGAFKHLDTPQGDVSTSAYSGTGVVTVGNYTAQAEFENGNATIRIQLLRVGDGWKINGFHINSDALLPPKTETTAGDHR